MNKTPVQVLYIYRLIGTSLNISDSNVIKHSDRDKVKITISAKEQDDFYEFAVADNGKGIDLKYHDRIFTIFQTLEARDPKKVQALG